MDTLGSRLEDARKRKGVSLREAAEATKIRSEYLSQFEADDFDIPLPEIYQRGFVKIYARYLGEEPEEFSRMYQSRINRVKNQPLRQDVRSSLGQLDVATRRKKERTESSGHGGGQEDSEETLEAAPARSKFKLPTRKKQSPAASSQNLDDEEYDFYDEAPEAMDRDFYLKVGIIVGSVAMALILIVILVRLISSGGEPEPINPGLDETDRPTEIVAPVADEEMIIRATGGRVFFSVQDAQTGERLDQGNLAAGESRRLMVTGPVRVGYTLGENIEVEKNGEIFAPSRPGAASIRIP